MENKVYIYGLKCPETNIIRYVGKSKNPDKRIIRHIWNATKNPENIHLARWINKLIASGSKPILEILEECDLLDWKEKEKYWINKLFNLCNRDEGGIEPPDNTGFKWTEEQKKNHPSHLRKGKPQWVDTPHPLLGKEHPAKGQKRDDEFCELMRKQRLENNGMRGVKLTEDRVNQIKQRVRKPVELIDKDEMVLNTFVSCKEAGILLKVDAGNISKVCNGIFKQTNGYFFRFKK